VYSHKWIILYTYVIILNKTIRHWFIRIIFSYSYVQIPLNHQSHTYPHFRSSFAAQNITYNIHFHWTDAFENTTWDCNVTRGRKPTRRIHFQDSKVESYTVFRFWKNSPQFLQLFFNRSKQSTAFNDIYDGSRIIVI